MEFSHNLDKNKDLVASKNLIKDLVEIKNKVKAYD